MRRIILVVEDNEMNRRLLKAILKDEYTIMEACDGVQALEVIEREGKRISAIILDIMMPRMDGYEVLERMQRHPDMNQIPVIVATAIDDNGAEKKAFEKGAIEYVTKPYDPRILKQRLQNTIKLREQAAIVNATRIDALTGLYTRSAFFELAAEKIESHEPGFYVMASFDVERFKVINDQYGSAKGDEVLRYIAYVFMDGFREVGGIGCRIMADHFAILYPRSFLVDEKLSKIRERASTLDGSIPPITFSIGRYFVNDFTLSPAAMYDRATLARETVKGRYDVHIAEYDELLRNRLLEEQEIISEMKQALAKRQFEVWYQPQVNHLTGTLIGAEALVRWRHPTKGLISPGVFIPIFEKNGFIYELDKFVWEEVCRYVKEMKNSTYPVVPVSVNISRFDIYHNDLIKVITGLTKRYEILPAWLQIEITESAFAESESMVISVVKEFRKLGYTVEIDDFGSGYSSLNTLKNVPADVLKLDMKFMEYDGDIDSDRGGSIVESVVRMAKWLGMSVITEGVEKREQAEFLKTIGCYYIQGYFYSKPLPKHEYEQIRMRANFEERRLELQKVEIYNNDRFWNPASLDTIIFNSFVGGAGIFEYNDGQAELIRINERYAKVLSGEENPKLDMVKWDWLQYMTEEGANRARLAIERAIQTKEEIVDVAELRGVPGRSGKVYIRTMMRIIAGTSSRHLVYCIIEDITEQRKSIQKEQALLGQLQEKVVELEKLNATMHHLIEDIPGGFVQVHADENGEFSLDYFNESFCDMCGLTNYQVSTMCRKMIDGVHPEDVKRVVECAIKLLNGGTEKQIRYRIRHSSGQYIPVLASGRVTVNEKGEPAINIFYSDISEEIKEEERRKELIENLPCGAGIFGYEGGRLVGKYLNRIYWQLVGRESYDLESASMYAFVQKEDHAYLQKLIGNCLAGTNRIELELHLQYGEGRYVPFWVTGNVVKRNSDEMTLYAVFLPVQASTMSFRRMLPVALQTMMRSSTDLSFIKDRNLHYVNATKAFAQMAGYDDVAEIIGKNDFDLFSLRLATQYREDDLRLMRTGESMVNRTEELPPLNGQFRYSSTSKYPMKDEHGTILGIYGIGRDVTESKTAFEQLKLLTNSIPGGLVRYEVSPAGVRSLYISEGIERLTGYSSDKYDINTYDPVNYVFEEDRQVILSGIEEVKKGSDGIDCVFRIRHVDGSIRWINMMGRVTERRDTTVYANVVMTDITDQKNASLLIEERELENRKKLEHEQKLRRELISDSLIFYQLNLTTGILEEFETKLGDTEGMEKGSRFSMDIKKQIFDRIFPADRKRMRGVFSLTEMREMLKRGEYQKQEYYRRMMPNGGYHWIEADVSIMQKPEKGEAVAFFFCKDVDKEYRTQLVVNSILQDDIESIVYVKTCTGMARIAHMKEEINVHQIDKSFLFEEEIARLCEEQIMENERQAYLDFFRLDNLKARLRKEKVLNFSYQCMINGIYGRKQVSAYYLDDTRDCIVVTGRDITRSYAEEIRQKQMLEEAVERATAASQAKSNFLSHISHDIRTPLNAVLAFSNPEMLEGADEDKLREYLKKVNNSGDYLLGIVNDVLDMSRIEQNRISLKPEPYSIEEFEKTIRNVFEVLCQKRNVEFVVDSTNSGIRVIMVDHVRFNQIIMNLLSNAVKFTPSGGKVELIIEEVKGKRKGTIIKRFIVRDTGIGMSESFQPHAFESFKQEYRKENDQKSLGTGLGLSIVKELVEKMRGKVYLESQENVGTTFTVELPFDENEVLDTKPEVIKEDYERMKGVHILLAEDNDINMEIAVALLEKQGCVVDCAEHGLDAVEKFKASSPGDYQLILMDIQMPVMDGIAATRCIRGMKRSDAKTIPIIPMTADAFTEDEALAFEAGMSGYVGKPYKPEELYHVCCRFLREAEENR